MFKRISTPLLAFLLFFASMELVSVTVLLLAPVISVHVNNDARKKKAALRNAINASLLQESQSNSNNLGDYATSLKYGPLVSSEMLEKLEMLMRNEIHVGSTWPIQLDVSTLGSRTTMVIKDKGTMETIGVITVDQDRRAIVEVNRNTKAINALSPQR